MRSRPSALVALVAVVVAACSSGGLHPLVPVETPVAGTPVPVSLTIYGAASLKAALAKVETAYETTHPGTTLTISTDSSTALETKIEQGAPADVFLSADTANPQKLVDRGLAAGAVIPFAANLLTVIVPAGNPAAIGTPADLARSGVKVIAAAGSVPITKYATLLVANLGKQAGYPSGFAAAYGANIVSREDNVAAVVAKVELGEGDAAIVYRTDARTSTKVVTVAVPDAANVPATYGGVVVKTSDDTSPATAFLAWLAGPDGLAILGSVGFLPPD